MTAPLAKFFRCPVCGETQDTTTGRQHGWCEVETSFEPAPRWSQSMLESANCGAAFFLGQMFGSMDGCCNWDEVGHFARCSVWAIRQALEDYPEASTTTSQPEGV